MMIANSPQHALFHSRAVTDRQRGHGLTSTYYNHHHTTTVLRPFFRDHPGEPVPEENFWTLRCKGRLTETDTPTIRMTGRHSIRTNQCPPPPSSPFFTGRMPFLLPNQQRHQLPVYHYRRTSSFLYLATGYGDGAGNTAEENSSVFSLIRMR